MRLAFLPNLIESLNVYWRNLAYIFFILSWTIDLRAQQPAYQFEFFSESKTRIPSEFMDIEEGPDGRLWMATRLDGVVVYDGYDYEYVRNDPADTLGIMSNQVFCITKMNNGELWFGTNIGLSIYSDSSRSFHSITPAQLNPDVESNSCRYITEASEDIVYIATASGLLEYHRSHQTIEAYYLDEIRGAPSDMSSNFILGLALDPADSNILWLGTKYGLKTFNRTSKKFEHILNLKKWHNQQPQYKQYYISELKFISDHTLWMTAFGSGGILRYNTNEDSWEQFLYNGGNFVDPYFGNRTMSVFTFSDSTVFFGSFSGLGIVDFERAEITYEPIDLSSRMGVVREIYLDHNGMMWIVGKGGFARSKKPITTPSNQTRIPVISDLIVDDTKFDLSQTELILPARHRSITIEMKQINPLQTENLKYRWFLEGQESTWRAASSERIVNYRNLKGGNYVFRFATLNALGQWIEGEPLQWKVARPLYLEPYFIFLLLAGAAMVVFAAIKLTASITRSKLAIKNNYEKKLMEAELATLRSQMNPHFIFNSLNSIYNFILVNDTENAADYLVKFSKLMRMVLQQSKETMIKLEDELEVIQLYVELEHIRFNDQFTYDIKVNEQLDVSRVMIPPMLIQPYLENAIWHGLMHKEGVGHLEVLIDENDSDLLTIIVRDDGIGRKRAANQQKRKNKKSMGMNITRKRLDAFEARFEKKAQIKVNDLVDPRGEPCGTEVILKIPLIDQSLLR